MNTDPHRLPDHLATNNLKDGKPGQVRVPPSAKSQNKKRIIFVGAFTQRPGVHGGQLAACTSLMQSSFAEAFEIIEVDSTQYAVPPPSIARRTLGAFHRLITFVWQTVWQRPDAALIFLVDGLSFLEKGAMALFAKSVGMRVVVAPRSGYLADHYARYALLRWTIRRVFGKADVVICQGQYWADIFAGMGAQPRSKCAVLKNWIDASIFSGVPEIEVGSAPLRLGFLAWVEKSKGIFDLIKAVADLRFRGRAVELEVAGNGRDLDAAKKLAEELGVADIVRFSGWLSGVEKLRFLTNSQVIILPSYAEGLPNTILEAMAAGRPVIATSVGAIPDVLASSGAGILHAPGDVSALRAAIEFYDDHRAELAVAGVRARTVIARDHSVENASRLLQGFLGEA